MALHGEGNCRRKVRWERRSFALTVCVASNDVRYEVICRGTRPPDEPGTVRCGPCPLEVDSSVNFAILFASLTLPHSPRSAYKDKQGLSTSSRYR